MDTMKVIKELLENNFGIDAKDVTPRSTFESLQLDSLDTIEIISDLEDEFDIELDDLDGLTDLESLIDYIDDLREE